ncbi:hypothetical protein HDU83_006336 [Entophlyctis luteolus]|nr:hypothetical protein HDU83_006336 [Entophlyctis luteolus]KAJ3392752.1 hypothetical protein HDU84_003489 [Entophlyctis sp. JEL0112]
MQSSTPTCTAIAAVYQFALTCTTCVGFTTTLYTYLLLVNGPKTANRFWRAYHAYTGIVAVATLCVMFVAPAVLQRTPGTAGTGPAVYECWIADEYADVRVFVQYPLFWTHFCASLVMYGGIIRTSRALRQDLVHNNMSKLVAAASDSSGQSLSARRKRVFGLDGNYTSMRRGTGIRLSITAMTAAAAAAMGGSRGIAGTGGASPASATVTGTSKSGMSGVNGSAASAASSGGSSGSNSHVGNSDGVRKFGWSISLPASGQRTRRPSTDMERVPSGIVVESLRPKRSLNKTLSRNSTGTPSVLQTAIQTVATQQQQQQQQQQPQQQQQMNQSQAHSVPRSRRHSVQLPMERVRRHSVVDPSVFVVVPGNQANGAPAAADDSGSEIASAILIPNKAAVSASTDPEKTIGPEANISLRTFRRAQRLEKSDRKLMMKALLIAIGFLVCWTPATVVHVLEYKYADFDTPFWLGILMGFGYAISGTWSAGVFFFVWYLYK